VGAVCLVLDIIMEVVTVDLVATKVCSQYCAVTCVLCTVQYLMCVHY